MNSGLIGSGEGDEHNSVGFFGISKIFAMQDIFVFGTEPYALSYWK